MAPNMPNSKSLGSRPSKSRMRAYSAGVMPMARNAGNERVLLLMHGLDQGAKDHQPVCSSQEGITGALWVRHQRKHIAPRIPQAGDTGDRAVRIAGSSHLTL